jgi:hypothetical protein
MNIDIDQASDLAGRCKRLWENAEELQRDISYLLDKSTACDNRGLRYLLADVQQASARMQKGHVRAQALWDNACAAVDQVGAA